MSTKLIDTVEGRVVFFRTSDGMVWNNNIAVQDWEAAPSSAGAWSSDNLISPTQTGATARWVYSIPADVQIVDWDASLFRNLSPNVEDLPDERPVRPPFETTAERCPASRTFHFTSPDQTQSPRIITKLNGFVGEICFDFTNRTNGVSLSSATFSIATGTGTKPTLSNVRLTDDLQMVLVKLTTVDGTTGEEDWTIICTGTRVDSVVDPCEGVFRVSG